MRPQTSHLEIWTSRHRLILACEAINNKKPSYCWQTARRLCYSFPCCTIKSCPLVNDCNLLLRFSNFYLPLSHLTPSLPLGYLVHVWRGKTRMAGLQSGEDHMMIDSVVWAQYINVTDRHTDTQTRRHSKCHIDALCQAAKSLTGWWSSTIRWNKYKNDIILELSWARLSHCWVVTQMWVVESELDTHSSATCTARLSSYQIRDE